MPTDPMELDPKLIVSRTLSTTPAPPIAPVDPAIASAVSAQRGAEDAAILAGTEASAQPSLLDDELDTVMAEMAASPVVGVGRTVAPRRARPQLRSDVLTSPSASNQNTGKKHTRDNDQAADEEKSSLPPPNRPPIGLSAVTSSAQLSAAPSSLEVLCPLLRPVTAPFPPVETKAWNLRILSWNIQNLGGGVARTAVREPPVIEAIARILHHTDADVSVIIEVMQRHGGHERVPTQPSYFSDHTIIVQQLVRQLAAQRRATRAKKDQNKGAWEIEVRVQFEAAFLAASPPRQAATTSQFGRGYRSNAKDAFAYPDAYTEYKEHSKYFDSEADDMRDAKRQRQADLAAAKAGTDKADTGVRELARIADQMNRIGGKPDKYGVWPSLEDAKDHKKVYNNLEAYGFIYKLSTCQFIADNSGYLVDATRYGFSAITRLPFKAQFLFGDTPVAILAWHAPSDDEGNIARRGSAFPALLKFLEESRGRDDDLLFFATDLNVATHALKPNKSGKRTPHTHVTNAGPKAPTIDHLFKNLSDDPVFLRDSLFAFSSTSLRESTLDRTPTTIDTLIQMEFLQAMMQAKGHPQDGMSGYLARIGSFLLQDGRTDPFAHHYNPFDKLVVANGGRRYVRTKHEWIVNLLATVAGMREQHLIWETPLQPMQYFGLLQGVGTLIEQLWRIARGHSKTSDSGAQIPLHLGGDITRELLEVAHVFSDHSPIAADFEITFPQRRGPKGPDLDSKTPVLPDHYRAPRNKQPAPVLLRRFDGKADQWVPKKTWPDKPWGTIHQLACLAQEENTCGQRASYNAGEIVRWDNVALRGPDRAELLNHEMYTSFMGWGRTNIADNEVVDLLTNHGHNQIAVISDLRLIQATDVDPGLRAMPGVKMLHDFCIGSVQDVTAVVNTAAAVVMEADLDVEAAVGVFHYIAVRLWREADQVNVIYADSLQGDTDYAVLFNAMIREINFVNAGSRSAAPSGQDS